MTAPQPEDRGNGLLSRVTERKLLALAGFGALVTLLAFLIDLPAARAGLLVAAQFAIGIALGGLLFIVFGFVMKAGWSVALRRVPEAMAGIVPYAGAFVFLTIVLCLGAYEWSHADAVAGDALLQHKSGWLNVGGVLMRAAVFVILWTLFARALVRVSRAQDTSSDPAGATTKSVYLSCGFLAVFAVTYSLATFDWIMSLEAHWFSTVFAIYNFSSLFLSAIAVMILIVIALRRWGPLKDVVRADHLHDLGKITLGLTVFWAYIWFCQYMLIWYSDIPEETTYYVSRMKAPWEPWMLLNLAVNWLIPFLLLLPRPAKRSEGMMARVAVLLLFARFLDLHLLIAPPLTGDRPWTILWAVGPVVLVLSLLAILVFRKLAEAPAVPQKDPYLGESLAHHT